ncbi:MAG: DinB family protein [Melioribacteraceae bacterium]|nr:DinB family protein [Melioribacteraceae bacterium]MCF8264686.1 DinB family protein [Melioribacteraceae bacterium]MCF8413463.1 DinB family protein [Melioribacteraceae bacterium]MCF8432565.1 DinB family protein [Melioribacteraceae bacterium]
MDTRPSPGKWSASECIQHLNQTIESYLPNLKTAIDGYKSSSTTATDYKRTLKIKLISKFLSPPYKLKSKTFTELLPKTNLSVDKIRTDFLENQKNVMEIIDSLSLEELNEIKIASPFKSSLKFKLGELFEFLAVHQQRHLWQAQKHLALLEIQQ